MKVGVDAIDKDHQVLVTLINRINNHASDLSKAVTALHELNKYTNYHFRREEMIMQVCGYPGLEQHRHTHRQLANRVVDIDKEIFDFARGKEQRIRALLAPLE